MKPQTLTETAETPASLEKASRVNSTHLDQLEKSLATSLQSGRHLPSRQALPHIWDRKWQGHWDNIEEILERTRTHVNELVDGLESHVENNAGEHLSRAMSAWEAIQCEGDFLQQALAQVRVQADQLSAGDRENWNTLARTLEYELEAIHYFAQAMRIKLMLLNGHSQEEAGQVVQSIITQFPERQPQPGNEEELYDHEYRRAVLQLREEQHKFLGFLDIFKSLLMWVETPEERMIRNRSLQVGSV
jgi:hypothetical protein